MAAEGVLCSHLFLQALWYMGLIKNQSSFPSVGNRADRMLVPEQAKTQVSVGGIHTLPAVTRWAQLRACWDRGSWR